MTSARSVLKNIIMVLLLLGFVSVAFAASCTATVDYTQIGDNSTCDSLTINSGVTWDTNGHLLNVSGLVAVSGLLEGRTNNHTFGSLLLNSEGTYNATSGTTLVTSKTPDGLTWTKYNNTIPAFFFGILRELVTTPKDTAYTPVALPLLIAI